MIVTEQKSFEEILESLKDEGKIFIAACGGCPEGAETGGETEVANITKRFEG